MSLDNAKNVENVKYTGNCHIQITNFISESYAILFTDTASVFQVARPCQAKRTHFKVTICKHVG